MRHRHDFASAKVGYDTQNGREDNRAPQGATLG